MKQALTIVVLSDTHGHHRTVQVPEGDVLVFAGDLMTCGRKFSEVRDFADWFMKQPHDHKVLVAGNHDLFFEHSLGTCLAQFNQHLPDHPCLFTYLQDSWVNIRGWNFWGSPYTPWFNNWAFNKYRGPDIKRHWDMIPLDTDVLITHGPPFGVGDYCNPMPKFGFNGGNIGCQDLMDRVKDVKPTVHIFGHIHDSYGYYIGPEHQVTALDGVPVGFFNVSICNDQYEPIGKCTILDLHERYERV